MVDVRLHTETERIGYGTFRFAKLPVRGDWVKVEPACTYGGAFVVVRVEPHPIALPIPPTAKQDPSVSVHVLLSIWPMKTRSLSLMRPAF